jgi:GNAT superfamily N-acetyltransferase
MELEPIVIARLDQDRLRDFYRVHSAENEADWCMCSAWWVPTWDGWGDRTATENRSVREALFQRGEFDGYLGYLDGKPVGWCQAGPRDRLEKLCRQLGLAPDAAAWAITCFLIVPAHRHAGVASAMLHGVLEDLQRRGVRRVEAFPKRGEGLDAGDLWNGPEAMFLQAGFRVARDDPRRPVLVKQLE